MTRVPISPFFVALLLLASITSCLYQAVGASRVSASSLLQSAKKDFLARDFAGASLKFQELLEHTLTYPQLKEALLCLCESRMREGKLVQADSVALEASRRLTDTVGIERIAFLRAEMLYFSGDVGGALQGYLTFLEANPLSQFTNDVIARLLLLDENRDNDHVPLVAYSRADFLQFVGMPDSAIAVLDDLLENFPVSQIADDAHMKKGEVLESQRGFSDAIVEYGLVEEHFPDSHLVPVCKLRMARLYSSELNDKGKAVAEYESIITSFPGTSFTVQARSQLQKLNDRADRE